MVQRRGGMRRKTRSMLRKPTHMRGKIALREYLKEFDPGTRVALVLNPTVADGIFHRRFHGKTGVVLSKQGRAYEVSLTDGDKPKKVMVHPAHLKALEVCNGRS